MTKVLLLGAKGMFGTDARDYLLNSFYNVSSADIPEVDITDIKSLKNMFEKAQPEIVINAAAFTDVDGAEKKREEALKVNFEGAANVAKMCKEKNVFLVHISTDYVFPGTKKEGYLPNDEGGPATCFYGETKLMAENEIKEILSKEKFLICRTQWLYGKNGKNFVKTIVNLAREKSEIDVVDDQWGVPTWTKDLIEQIDYLLKTKYSGFAHTVGGGGPITWYKFAVEILELVGSNCKVNRISSDKLKRDAKRPKYGFLRNDIVPNNMIRDYKVSLKMYLKEENIL